MSEAGTCVQVTAGISAPGAPNLGVPADGGMLAQLCLRSRSTAAGPQLAFQEIPVDK